MSDASRYPGYDVLAKRDTPSWDEPTRRAIDNRLQVSSVARFFTPDEWAVANALCRRILPQGDDTEAVALAALLDAKLYADHGDGFREADMPYMQEAWRLGLAALEAEAKDRHDGQPFAVIGETNQDALLRMMQNGSFNNHHWRAIAPKNFSTAECWSMFLRSIMVIRRRGTRLDLVAPQVPADMCVSRAIGAIRGRRPRRWTATKSRRNG